MSNPAEAIQMGQMNQRSRQPAYPQAKSIDHHMKMHKKMIAQSNPLVLSQFNFKKQEFTDQAYKYRENQTYNNTRLQQFQDGNKKQMRNGVMTNNGGMFMHTSQNIYDASTVYTMPSSNLNKTSRSSAVGQVGH